MLAQLPAFVLIEPHQELARSLVNIVV